MTVRQHGGDSAPHGTRGALVTLPEAFGLLALFAFAVYFLFRAPHHRTPTDPLPLGAAHAAREAKPLDPQRVEAIYNILCSKDQQNRKTKGKREYSIGIITALQEEFRAAISMLDEEHNAPSDFQKSPEDSNDYVWGRIAQHNVVIVSFPSGIYGTSIAARVATLLVSSFPSIRLGFMVGIGGGVPSPSYDIRLGDVVVSKPGQGTAGGVVQYDLGKEEEGQFRRTGSLNKPPSALLSALTSFQARPRILELCETIRHASTAIYQAFEFDKAAPTYAYQGSENDRLFRTYKALTLFPWQSARPMERRKRPRPEIPTIHYGLIASGNRVMKNGRERDHIAATLKQETNGGECLCFEMEAAGLMDNFPCLVIRGISDYADSHKGHSWHGYASMTAAAFVREVLHVLKPTEVESSTKACEIMSQVRQDVQEIKADVSTLSNLATMEEIKKWLAPSDHTKNFEDAREARYNKTNAWLFEHNTYQSWLSGELNCIWLYGPSGCGKTVLSSTVIDALMKNGLCLYFFFDFRDQKKQTLKELLLSLVCQLSSTSNGAKEVLHQLYSSRVWNETKPSTESLIKAFGDMLLHSGQVRLVLDALDESKKGKDREELLQWLHRQIQRLELKECKLRIIITSRSGQQDIIDTVGVLIPERATLSVEDNAFKVRDDIRKFIERRIMNDGMFARWRNQPRSYSAEAASQSGERSVSEDQLCSKIESEPGKLYPCKESEFETLADESEWDPILRKARDVLFEKAGTMFRWASLQLDSLGSLGSSEKIEEALADLPEGLYDIYTRSLREIPKRHIDDAVRILEMILASKRTLTVEIALELMSVDLKAPPGRSIKPAKKMKDLTPLSSIMSVLIKMRRGHSNYYESSYLEIAHSSVRDYLSLGTPEPCLRVSFSDISCRASLVRICLAHLGSIYCLQFPHQRGYSGSMQSYLCTEWIAHARNHEVGKEAYEDILKFLFCMCSKVRLADAILHYNEVPHYTGPPLFLASALGLSGTVERLLEHGISPNELGGKANTTIRTNSYYKGKLPEFPIDLDGTIGQIDDRDSKGLAQTALSIACIEGYPSVVRVLLDHGAELHLGESPPLEAACSLGYNELATSLAIVQMLIEKGVDVNAEGGEYTYALHAACDAQSHELVELLLKNGADVNAPNADGETALYLMSRCGSRDHADVVSVLLDYGADTNAKGGKYTYALHAACYRRQDQIVELLLKNGADVNSQNEDDKTPLYLACGYTFGLDIVRMLLDYGADPNGKGGEYGTPLRHACLCESSHRSLKDVVEMLLGRGADPNDYTVYDDGFGSPLMCAARHDHPEVVQTLLENGADIDLQHNGGCNALQIAIMRENFRVIKVLIENGANLDLLSDDARSNLLKARDEALTESWPSSAQRESFTPVVIKRLEDWEKSVCKRKAA